MCISTTFWIIVTVTMLFMIINKGKYKDCGQTRGVVERTVGLDLETLVQVLITSCIVLNRQCNPP